MNSRNATKKSAARKLTAAGTGVLLDRGVGEPFGRFHPVALFGSQMAKLESRIYSDSRAVGLAHAAIGIALGAGTGAVVRSTLVATTMSVAGRGLGRSALAVADSLGSGDLEGARRLLPSLVGRDPEGLDEKEIARAVVESVAENTVDAVVAPAFWAALLGSPGALGHRAIDTLDSMFGHRSPRYRNYGWASARMDDLAAFVPARLTAFLVACVRPSSATSVLRLVLAQARSHPSPNAGVAETAFAAALGLRLGGSNSYMGAHELRPVLGEGRPPEVFDIARAVDLSRDVALALAAGLCAGGVAMKRLERGTRHRGGSGRPR